MLQRTLLVFIGCVLLTIGSSSCTAELTVIRRKQGASIMVKGKSGDQAPANAQPTSQPQTAIQTTPERSSQQLEQQKLELEVAQLRAQLRGNGWLRWITILGPLFTTSGIIVTLWLGIQQLSQTRTTRDDERFERSVTRIGSLQPSERLTGIAGIQQFLRDTRIDRQESTVLFLINAAVIEKDPTVRSAILDLLGSLQGVSRQALDGGLRTARDRNRAIYKRLTDAFAKRKEGVKGRLVDPTYDEVPFGNPSADDRAALAASASAMAALLRAGGKLEDVSSTYCRDCIFSSIVSPVDLSNVNFDNAILSHADFSGALIRSSSFHNADLLSANFTAADLSYAKLTLNDAPPLVNAAYNSGTLGVGLGTIFACANLSYADFTGRSIFSLVYRSEMFGASSYDDFYNADLKGAKLGKSGFSIAVPAGSESQTPFGYSVIPAAMGPSSAAWQTSLDSVALAGDDSVKTRYLLSTGGWGSPINDLRPLPNDYGHDLVFAFSALLSARNLDLAELPESIRKFVSANSTFLTQPFVTSDCKGVRNGHMDTVILAGRAQPGPISASPITYIAGLKDITTPTGNVGSATNGPHTRQPTP